MRDSDSAGGVIVHTSFRSLHRAVAREFAGDLYEVIYRANLRLFRTFGLIPAVEGISRSRRARDTTLIVLLEAKLCTEFRLCALHPPYRATKPITILGSSSSFTSERLALSARDWSA